jgi:hypothetical protein
MCIAAQSPGSRGGYGDVNDAVDQSAALAARLGDGQTNARAA